MPVCMVQVRIVCDAERSTAWSMSGQQCLKAKHAVTAQAVVSHIFFHTHRTYCDVRESACHSAMPVALTQTGCAWSFACTCGSPMYPAGAALHGMYRPHDSA